MRSVAAVAGGTAATGRPRNDAALTAPVMRRARRAGCGFRRAHGGACARSRKTNLRQVENCVRLRRMGGYVFRLLGPRPTFPGDMTAEEAELMGQHAAYWRKLTRAGTAVAFGPVLDPAGVYGLGVVRADDEAAARAIADADPVVRARTSASGSRSRR